MELVIEYAKIEILDIELWVYLTSLFSIFFGFIGKKIVSLIFGRLEKIAEKTDTEFDDIVIKSLSKPAQWGIALAGVFVALLILPLPTEPIDIQRFVRAMLTSSSLVLVLWFGLRLTDGLSSWWEARAALTESKLDDQLVPIVRKSVKSFLYIIGVVLILQNLGYSVQSLLAGLGIGGLAVAMAAKDMVSNLFGSVVVFLDKPFRVGDWIEVGAAEGTVEEIGLRTTRIRTFANSLLTVPNAIFTNQVINNWSAMKKRRITMSIGVTYSSGPEKVNDLVDDIRGLIEENPKILSDFYIVNFDNFGTSSLDIFVYCFTITTNWVDFLQAKQEFMIDIMKAVKARDLSFAFPTQSVHLESVPSQSDVMTSQRPQ